MGGSGEVEESGKGWGLWMKGKSGREGWNYKGGAAIAKQKISTQIVSFAKTFPSELLAEILGKGLACGWRQHKGGPG